MSIGSIIGRGIATILIFAAMSYVDNLFGSVGTLATGKIAGMQMQSNDMSYIMSNAGMKFFSDFHVPGIVGLLLVATIWFGPLKSFIKGTGTTAALLFMLLLPMMSQPAKAYYDQKDFTEAYTILPNESAFWIPDVGDNKNSQAKLDSEDYLQANKIAAKRFIIPHTKLSGSGSFWDFYVPAGRLIIVDRTTYSHEWVDPTDRGSGKNKEGFPCQSKEGINITAGVSVGSSVTEQDAAKFLYTFGVKQPEGKYNRNDPAVIFNSVYYGRSLFEVMGDVGRKKIQTLVCNEIGKRTFDQANAEMIPLMDSVEKRAVEYFKTVGITINFIGWADTFEFDKPIQAAVNSSYVTKVDAQNASTIQQYMTTVRGLAEANAVRSFGEKFNGALPSTVYGGVPDINGLMFGIVNGSGNAPKGPAVKPQ